MKEKMEEEKTYRIGEVAEMLKLKTSVLRFWETEFSQVEPLRTAGGQRLYTEKNVRLLKQIQFLLHDKGMTIEGVKRQLGGAGEKPACQEDQFTRMLETELTAIIRILSGGDS